MESVFDNSTGNTEKVIAEDLTLLPLHELVLFADTVVPVFITAQPGISAVDEALQRDKRLLAACVKKREPGTSEIITWPVGTVVRIIQHLKLPDNSYRVVLQGEYRGKIIGMEPRIGYTLVKVTPINAGIFDDPPLPEDIALLRAVQRSFNLYAELSKKIGSDTLLAVERTENPERLANLVCNSAQLKPEKKVELLAVSGIRERLLALLETLEREN
jgi:ATP-dependent Lon protease